MDINFKLSVAINAINSFVRSLLFSFGLLKTNRLTSDGVGGSINFLPNEMMQLILTKLELDKDVKNMIRLRLVSTRWRSLVEDYCTQKKSLHVDVDYSATMIYWYIHSKVNSSEFKKRFYGFANLNDFTRLFVSYKIPSECLQSFLNLFANVVQLSIRCQDESLMRDFVAYANSLVSLKQLDLCRPFVSVLPSLSPTLAKLEHASFVSLRVGYPVAEDDDLQPTVSHFGSSCVRVSFGRCAFFDYDQVVQWHNINGRWLANLTHLTMKIHNCNSEESSKVVRYLSQHANLLELLNLGVWYGPLKMTPAVFSNLGKLTHLTILELSNIEMDISALDQAAQHGLSSLSSVLICKLCGNDSSINGDQFTRILSVIFPNLVDLQFYFGAIFASQSLRREVEQHLYRFPNLRKHNIG